MTDGEGDYSIYSGGIRRIHVRNISSKDRVKEEVVPKRFI